MTYIYILGTVCCTVYGQLVIKWRLENYGEMPSLNLAKLEFFQKVLLDPFILSGLVSAFVASLFWIAAASNADISFLFPITVAGLIVLTTSLAVILLGEIVTLSKVVGIAIIATGVIVIQYGSSATSLK